MSRIVAGGVRDGERGVRRYFEHIAGIVLADRAARERAAVEVDDDLAAFRNLQKRVRLAAGDIRAEHDGAPAVYGADKLRPRFDNDRLSAGVKRDDGEAPEKDGQRQKQAYGFF